MRPPASATSRRRPRSPTWRNRVPDSDAKTVGTDSAGSALHRRGSCGATALLGNAALTATHGGTPARDTAHETYSATLKCHDANGEIYMVTFGRQV